jgi:hypothetical protein
LPPVDAPRSRTAFRSLAATVVVLTALASVAITNDRARAENKRRWSWQVASGVRLIRIRYPGPPHEVRILRVTPSQGSRVDIGMGAVDLPLWNKTSQIASRLGAVAGVNGDFTTARGAPKHVTMVDGELWTSGWVGGSAFGISAAGQRAFAGQPSLTMRLTRPDGHGLMRVAAWNVGVPRRGTVKGYTRRGGKVVHPPGAMHPDGSDPTYCAARLEPIKGEGYVWSGKRETSITRRYRVDAQPEPCRKSRLARGSTPGAVVLAARAGTKGARKIMALRRGRRVRLWWSFQGWPGVTDVIGASQVLLRRGHNVAPGNRPGGGYILENNPRTAVGVSRSCSDRRSATACKIFIVTVDGRQPGWSKGMMLPRLADELKRAGAWSAVNLDGGGSTTAWVRKARRRYCQEPAAVGGCFVNRSSFDGERNVIQSLAALSGGDPGTPRGLK